jgi:excisionase family DNA binding protein
MTKKTELTILEVAERLGVSQGTVWSRVQDGTLAGRRVVGADRRPRLMIPAADVSRLQRKLAERDDGKG